MTTAPARPTLLGPDGQALTSTTDTDDWKPVRAAGNAVVWERPRPVQPVPTPLAADPLADAQAEAEMLLENARTEADRITAEADSLRTRTLAEATSEAAEIRDQTAAAHDAKEARSRGIDVWMARAVIVGAVGLTATGEYSLARLAHFPRGVAWLLPFVIDIYVIQAFRRHRDIVQAIGLTIAANVVYHLAAAGMFGVTPDADGRYRATWWLIAMVASIASVILWRMHVMTDPPRLRNPADGAGTEATPKAVSDAPTGPVLDTQPAPVPTPPGTDPEQQEQAPVPAVGTALTPSSGTGTQTAATPPLVPALRAVPASTRKPVHKPRSTGPRTRRSTARSAAPKTGTGTASFEDHVATARGWLKSEPGLSGADIGKRLGTKDSYGRRVKRAATT